jgi:hypothetical protein
MMWMSANSVAFKEFWCWDFFCIVGAQDSNLEDIEEISIGAFWGG